LGYAVKRSPLQTDVIASVQEVSGGADAWGWLRRQGKVKPFQQESLVVVGLGVAAQDQGAAIGGRKVDIEHLDGGKPVENRAGGETRGQGPELCS
jgi:hypothetical protein